MTPVPHALVRVEADCPYEHGPLDFQGDTWACFVCQNVWDADGTNGRSGALPDRLSILDRDTDSTSGTILDRSQPDVP